MQKKDQAGYELRTPSVKKLAKVYQNALVAGHATTSESARQAIYAIGAAEAAVAEATVLSSFLDEV